LENSLQNNKKKGTL